MVTNEITIRRKDVVMNEDKLDAFLHLCVIKGYTSAEVFQASTLSLSGNGNVIIELCRPEGVPQFEVFEPGEWEPGKKASGDVELVFYRTRPRPATAEIYDIFTGKIIDPDRKEKRFGERLQAAIERREQNAF
jgi:hypothetical protein